MATDRSDRYTECSLDLYQVQTIQEGATKIDSG